MKNRGFTIVESLAAIAILVTAIVGTLSAVQTGLSSYVFSKDQITAFYLAQEGFEQIRNLRDKNRINNQDFIAYIAGVNDPCFFGEACMVSPAETSALTRCSSPGNCPKLRQDPTTGFFGYNGAWKETPFRREIVLSSINANEFYVTVTVDWSKGSVTRQFKARENLFNW
jgi:hypothetical protein